jgi:hypothetical protein
MFGAHGMEVKVLSASLFSAEVPAEVSQHLLLGIPDLGHSVMF